MRSPFNSGRPYTALAVNSAAVTASARALRKAFLFTRDHPEETAAYVKSVNPQQNLDYELAGLKESNTHIYTWTDDEKTFGTFDPDKVKTTYQWVVRAGKADPSGDPESFIDRSYLSVE